MLQNGISGNLEIVSHFLSDGKQRVLLSRQMSTWKIVNTDILEISILGSLLFLIYINDLSGISGNLEIVSHFLSDGKQSVLLNWQMCTWRNVNTDILETSILGSLLFLIYINDLFGNLCPRTKLLVNDILLFSVLRDTNSSTNKVIMI